MQSIKLSLNVLKKEDCEILFKWISKKRIRFFLSSAFRQKKISLNILKMITKKNNSKWFIISVNKEKIGCVVLDDIDSEDRIANLWYLIGEEKYLKKNITYKILNYFLTKNLIKLNAVTAWVSSNNIGSNKLLNKLKFTKMAKIPKTFKIGKKYYDRILYFKSLR